MPRINARSELLHSRWLQYEEALFWGLVEPPEFETADDDVLHTVSDADRIDNLAYSYYGDSNMQWVIKWANDIRLYPNDFVTGMELRIPSFDRLVTEGIVVR